MRRASAKAKTIMARDPKQSVNFRDWTEVLAGTVLPWERQSALRFEVIRYLHWCQQRHSPASVASAHVYLADPEEAADDAGRPIREALRWFFRMAWAREQPDAGPPRPV
jgi:hypothetical protein